MSLTKVPDDSLPNPPSTGPPNPPSNESLGVRTDPPLHHNEFFTVSLTAPHNP